VSWARRNRITALLAGVAAVAVAALVLLGLWAPEGPTVPVTVQTSPPGAEVSYVPLHGETGLPQPKHIRRAKAGAVVQLPPGRYLVVAVLPGGKGQPERFHEVFRLVPQDPNRLPMAYRHETWDLVNGIIELPEITLPEANVAEGMSFFPGAKEFMTGDEKLAPALAPRWRCRVPAFYLDPTEVTWAKFRRLLDDPVSRTDDNYAAASVTWDQAVAHAEKEGKRLPDEIEYEYAATAGGQWRFPWGNDPGWLRGKTWHFGPVGQPADDRLERAGQSDVFGLYSNVLEWTSSWPGPIVGAPDGGRLSDVRIVRGGPEAVLKGPGNVPEPLLGPRERFGLVFTAGSLPTLPGLGFRCARSAKPRRTADDFGTARPR
jgi:formylglycine-generating enzyme required for sulfatase activity